MKRMLFLLGFVCMIALMGASANGGAAYEALPETVLIQQSLGQHFGVMEVVVVQADPLQTDFVLFALYRVPREVVACMPGIAIDVHGIGFGELLTINETAGQTNFVNFSPGIITNRAEGEQFLS
jgi:hypothetical protein